MRVDGAVKPEVKWIIKFAWWPVYVGHSYKRIWLRSYRVKYELLYSDGGCNDCFNPHSPCDPDSHNIWQEIHREVLP